jgi:ParB family chromosome partitioning protein
VADEAMTRLAESIKQYGVREPGLARPRPDGGYELLVGNRRKYASELAERLTMPVIIRELDNDDAVIAMVDSNLEHRDKLLPSERAWAYKMKMEALNHKGIKGDKLSAEIVAAQNGDSRSQVFRMIRLTELIVDLLDKVDTGKLALNPAVELSSLSQSEQKEVVSVMEENEMKPSLSQAVRLKKLKQDGKLTKKLIQSTLSEAKPKATPVDKGLERFRKYFPAGYSVKQMNDIIEELLKVRQNELLTQNKNTEITTPEATQEKAGVANG